MSATREVDLFPLGTVLFPGGRLPLKVFEQRYIGLTKRCLRDDVPFGVCLIREGREVGTPALPHPVGCLARIRNWDMPQTGLFMLDTEGTERFRILEHRAAADGLLIARVELLPEPHPVAPPDDLCERILRELMREVGEDHFPAPHRFDDASWIAFRLAEALPIPAPFRQELLETNDAAARLAAVRGLFRVEA